MRTAYSFRGTSLALCWILLVTAGCQDNPVTDTQGAPSAHYEAQATAALLGDDYGATHGAIPFADAEVFFEFNTTDGDLGLQVFLDAEGWEKVGVGDPDLNKIVQLTATGPLADLGITELRFESAEPSPDEVLALFPPGTYEFRGRTVEGEMLTATSELSHDFAAIPTFSPSDGEEVDPDNLVVTWDAPDAELVEIILESDDSDAVFDVIVEGDVSSLTIPPQFLATGQEYKIEILVYAENRNRTIAESTFVTSM